MFSSLTFIDLSQFSQSDLILVGVGALILIWILFKVAKTLVRVAILAVLALALYFIWTGKAPNAVLKPAIKAVVKKQSINDLYERFCTREKKDKAICACIVQPLFNDVLSRNDRKSMKALDKDALADETMIAYENQKDNISTCLKEKKEDKLKIVELLKEQLTN